MQFEKGRGKTGGRKPGSTNKASTDIKSKIAALIDEQFDAISTDLAHLEPKERVTAYLKFLEYVLPKQREQINPEPEETFRRVYRDAAGNVVIEQVPTKYMSTPFQIIDPDTKKIIDLNIDAG